MANVERFIIVVGIDFSEEADRALDRALVMASRRDGGAEVHVVHVKPDLRSGAMPTYDELCADAVVDHVWQRTRDRMKALSAALDVTRLRRVVAHYRRGAPADGIAQLAAELHADVIIVGSRSDEQGHPAHGALAANVRQLAKRPVLVVPATEGFPLGKRMEGFGRPGHATRRASSSSGVHAAEATVYEADPGESHEAPVAGSLVTGNATEEAPMELPQAEPSHLITGCASR